MERQTKTMMEKKLEKLDLVKERLAKDFKKVVDDCNELKADLVEAVLIAENAKVALDETLEEDLLEERKGIVAIREGTRGHPLVPAFVSHCRNLLATGGSARSVREQIALNCTFFLGNDDAQHFSKDMPEVRWFQFQREGMGLESMVFTFIRLAKAKRVDQWGFDETSLDGVPTLNQWCRVVEDEEAVTLTIECAGLLPGSTSDKVISHIRTTWERGQEVVVMVRQV